MSSYQFARIASLGIVAVFMTVSLAVAGPCTRTAAPIMSPAHPGPDDRIAIRLPSDAIPAFDGARVLAAAFIDSTINTIYLDVLISADTRPFPGHRLVNDASIDALAYIGPLEPGAYSVVITLNGYDPTSRTINSLCNDTDAASIASTLLIAPVAAPTITRAIVEYYNAALDHYFMTQDAGEIQSLDSGHPAGWTRTGSSFAGYVASQSDGRGKSAARYYGRPSAGLDTHFFSIRDEHPGPAWILESNDAFELAQPESASGECTLNATIVSVYRLWNHRTDSNHRYTTSAATKSQMMARGWLPEGYGPDAVMMCAPAT